MFEREVPHVMVNGTLSYRESYLIKVLRYLHNSAYKHFIE